MVTDTWKILHTTTTNENDRVLLEIVAFIRNVCDDFKMLYFGKNLTDFGSDQSDGSVLLFSF